MEKKGFKKFVLGALVGIGLGFLVAPKKGSETRRDLKEKIDELALKASEIDREDIRFNIENKIFEIREELELLDKEKVLEIARVKSEDLKRRCEELVLIAKNKGNEVIAEMSQEVLKKAIATCEEILRVLEEN